jgi:hypothetical protein
MTHNVQTTYSNRYDYILEAVEIAEELDELKLMKKEDTSFSDDLEDWEGIISFDLVPKKGLCSLS